MIVAGERDYIIPREAQEIMHQLIPGSKFELIRNGSHCPQMDIPELVNVIIERFLAEQARRAERPKLVERPYSSLSGSSTSSPITTSETQTSRQGDVS
jgi:hypothetical protein